MKNHKAIKAKIESHLSIKGLIEVYEEMAATAMKEIREAIVGSREYYHGLAQLSAEIGTDLSTLPQGTKKKNALVLLSADQGMYGEIVDSVFGSFLHSVKAQKGADIYIAGMVGAQLMKTLAPSVQFTLLPLPKNTTDLTAVLTELAKDLVSYAKVELFFGQFQSIARQEPSSRSLTSQLIELTKDAWAGETTMTLKYLYEPDVQGISKVFAQEIFAGIFEQTYKEGELAKHASRLMHLDQAMAKIEKSLETDTRRYHTWQKRASSKKIQAQFSGYKMNQKVRSVYV